MTSTTPTIHEHEHPNERKLFTRSQVITRLLAAATRLVPLVPPRIGYPWCTLLGALIGPHTPAWPQVQANLSVTMPTASPAAHRAAAIRALIGMFENYYDLLRFHTLSPTALQQTCVIDGMENVNNALQAGHGLIIVPPHCGNYTIVFAAGVQHFDAHVLLVVEQIADPRLHELMNRVRRLPRIEIAALDRSLGRRIVQALRHNQVVVLAGDRAIAENSMIVDFFGRPTPLPSGPATLALRTHVPLLTAVSYRLPDNRSVIHFDPPLDFTRSSSIHDDIRDATQKIAYSMQAYIERDPSQWLVAERVWPSP